MPTLGWPTQSVNTSTSTSPSTRHTSKAAAGVAPLEAVCPICAIRAAQVDGIPTWRVYTAIIIPSMAPIFLSAFIVLSHLAIKSFDLVIALTGGGPGFASDLPATYMYAMAFSRGDIGQAASSAMIMMAVVFTIVVPYLYSELRAKND